MNDTVCISLERVALTFGGKPLFEDITLHIATRDRICLLGRNGAGKTTLMKLITGELEPDTGKRFVLPSVSIGYLAQQVEVVKGKTIHAFVVEGLPAAEQTEEKHYLADIVIAPLGLDPHATMETLSGGQLRRASLARALVAEPDVLLLDEPTNHLDLSAIEWLENYLTSYRGAILVVSHDRTFLSNITSKVFWLDRGIIRTCPRGYAHYEAWAEALLEQEARELHNMQKKLEVDWTQGGVTGRRKRNVRRLRELHKLREKLKHDKASYHNTTRSLDLDPLSPALASKIVAEFRDVTLNFMRDGTRTRILEHFHLRIMRGDRIGILGANGSGKSTFLKLLVKELSPDSGNIKLGKNIEISYFDQNRTQLNPKKSLWQTLAPDGGDYVLLGSGEKQHPRHVCGYLKDFLFDPKGARDLVGTLSGGQQSRLMLAKILAQPGSVLILDEPTNDLDMDTLDMLQELISDYDGTLLIVSHDRDFLDRTVTRVLAFEGDAVVESHVGGYSDYMEAKSKEKNKDKDKDKNKTTTPPPNGDTVTSTSAAIHPPASSNKMSYKLKHELEKLPERIATLETEIAALTTTLADAELYTKQPEQFDKASRRLHRAQEELEAAELRWLELEEMAQAS
jgi:ABC transport system ATP-binding/permease protein